VWGAKTRFRLEISLFAWSVRVLAPHRHVAARYALLKLKTVVTSCLHRLHRIAEMPAVDSGSETLILTL
jgi:hypothetical protein